MDKNKSHRWSFAILYRNKVIEVEHMKVIFKLNMQVNYELDSLTELSLFMLAATMHNIEIESIYNLLKEHPLAFNLQGM